MINLQQFLNLINFKISEGQPFLWACYGKNAYSLDSNSNETDKEASVIFDTQTQEVFEMTIQDDSNNRYYRWVNPNYLEAHKKEAKERDIEFKEVYEGQNYIDLELAEDFLNKAYGIINNKPYDPRVMIDLEVSDETLFQLMKLAHEKDITLNALVEEILKEEIQRLEKINKT